MREFPNKVAGKNWLLLDSSAVASFVLPGQANPSYISRRFAKRHGQIRWFAALLGDKLAHLGPTAFIHSEDGEATRSDGPGDIERASRPKGLHMSAPTVPRNVLLTAGSVCLFAAFLPQWSTIKTSPPPVEQRVFTIGLPSDPWFRHVNETRENADRTVTYTTLNEYQIGIPSAVAAAAGVALLLIGWRIRRVPAVNSGMQTS